MPNPSLCRIALLLAFLPGLCVSQTLVQTGRYTAVYAVPTDAQRDPLSAIITIEFPEAIETLGEALDALLAETGFALTDALYWDVEVFALLNHSIPSVQRTLGPLTVLDAVKTLVGPAFDVIVDPVGREISFTLKAHAPVAEAEVSPALSTTKK